MYFLSAGSLALHSRDPSDLTFSALVASTYFASLGHFSAHISSLMGSPFLLILVSLPIKTDPDLGPSSFLGSQFQEAQ